MTGCSPTQALLDYPQAAFGEVASPRWQTLCEGLQNPQKTTAQLRVSAERRWELVSALQKAIRRGELGLALQLIATASGWPTTLSQLPRRLGVIACEDIGVGDETLTRFTVACSVVYTPKRNAGELPLVLSFLTDQMCSVRRRSRVACSLSLIAESASSVAQVPSLKSADVEIFSAIRRRATHLDSPDSEWRRWQRKNDWRGERMLRYLDLPLPFDLAWRNAPLQSSRILHDLPDYSYDLHTRVGRAVIQSLIRGERGAEALKFFFIRHNVLDRSTALGMALFYSEGAQLRDELFFEEVLDLEQRIIAQRFGLTISQWNDLRAHINDALSTGVIDRLRGEELERRASQMQLAFGPDKIGMEGGDP